MSITLESLLALQPVKYIKPKPDELINLDAGQEGVIIETNHMGLTKADSKYPILGIVGAEPCTGVIVYNRAQKTAAVWHMPMLSSNADTKFGDMVRHVRTDKEGKVHNEQKVDVWLVGGGQFGDAEADRRATFEYLIKGINAARNVEVVAADILDKPHPDCFAFDARTGQMLRGNKDITQETMWDNIPEKQVRAREGIVTLGGWETAQERMGTTGHFHNATLPEFKLARSLP